MDLGFLSIVLGVFCLFLSGFQASVRGINPFQLGWAFLALGVLIL